MQSPQIRQKFQQYFKDQGHKVLKSSTLIPQNDPSLLFTNAGMNPFKDYFLGLAKPPHSKICSIQKCLRAGGKHNDLEQVGHSPYHHTFFEMMGNFSFGAYFKREAIHYSLEFLTQHLNLPKESLYVSVFKEDKESAQIWQKDHGFTTDKIFFLGETDNFWRMGDTGPCGPCTEIYYYDGKSGPPKIENMPEIWNLVFMEFNELIKGGKKVKEPLPSPAVDTGMGLERLSAVLQNKSHNYHTDLFKGIITKLEKHIGLRYDFAPTPPQKSLKDHQVAFRVLADHSRALSFLISDGALPSNEGAGYVLRRILRRAFFYGQKLSSNPDILSVGTQYVVHFMGEVYPELNRAKDLISQTVKEESLRWQNSLKEGKAILLKKIKVLKTDKLEPALVWDMYSSYGFPPDLTVLIAKEEGFNTKNLLSISLNQLKKQFDMPTHKIRTQKLRALGSDIDLPPDSISVLSKLMDKAPKTLRTDYDTYMETGERGPCPKVLLALSSKTLNQLSLNTKKALPATEKDPIFKLSKGDKGFVVLDKTCFYPEGGGPVGDTGFLNWGFREGGGLKGQAKVLDTQKKGDWVFHQVEILTGELKKGDQCHLEVDIKRRGLIATSHSATHLLNKALREVLGQGAQQKGSWVGPGKLRFDFSHPKPLTKEQIQKIESTVCGDIQAGHLVQAMELDFKQALARGAVFLAGENYGPKVRLIQIGPSLELCGGIHVKNTLEIGDFKIMAETGVKSGVRRVLAYTSDMLSHWHKLLAQQNMELRRYLSLPLPQLVEPLPGGGVAKWAWSLGEGENLLLALVRKKEQELEQVKKQLKAISFNVSGILQGAESFTFKGQRGHLVIAHLPIEDRKLLAQSADNIKSKSSLPAVVVLMGAGGEAVPIVVTVAPEWQQLISAGDLLKQVVAPFLEGKGGGQARFALGSVKQKDRLPLLKDHILKNLT